MKRTAKTAARDLYPVVGLDNKEQKKFYQDWRRWLVSFLNENISTLRRKDFLKVFMEFIEKFYDGVVEPHEVPSLCVDTEKNHVSLTFTQLKMKGLLFEFHGLREASLLTGKAQEFRLSEPLLASLVRPRLTCYDPKSKSELRYDIIKKLRSDTIVFDKEAVSIQPVLETRKPFPMAQALEGLPRDKADIKHIDKQVKKLRLREDVYKEVYKALSPEALTREEIVDEFSRLDPDKDSDYHVARLKNLYRDLFTNKKEASPKPPTLSRRYTNSLEPSRHRPPGTPRDAEEVLFYDIRLLYFVPFETWYDEDMNKTLLCTIAPLLKHIPLATIGRCPRCLRYFECDPDKKETPFCRKCQNGIAVNKWRENNRAIRNFQEKTRGVVSQQRKKKSLSAKEIREILEQKKKQD